MRRRTLARPLLAAALAAFTLGAPGARADDDFEPNDSLQSAHFLGGPLQEPATTGALLTAEGAVLEGGGAQDFYSFTAFANVPIAIRVEPLASATSAADERNLRLRLWRRVSAQTNSFSLLAQIDFNEAGFAEYHPPIPYAAAGFMVVEIDSSDGGEGEQPYRVRISNQALEPSIVPELVLANGLEEIADGGGLSFGEVALGERGSLAARRTRRLSRPAKNCSPISRASRAIATTRRGAGRCWRTSLARPWNCRGVERLSSTRPTSANRS